MAEIWGAAIAVGGALGGAYLQNQGAKKAAGAAAATAGSGKASSLVTATRRDSATGR